MANPDGYCPDHSTGVSWPVRRGVAAGGDTTFLALDYLTLAGATLYAINTWRPKAEPPGT